MFNRAFSLLFLLSSFSLYPAAYVEMVVHGIKNIVIPTVIGGYTGQSTFTRRSRDAFFIESAMENRGYAQGVQRSYDNFSAPPKDQGALTPDSFNNPTRFSAGGMPLYDSQGRPTEEGLKEQARRLKQMQQGNKTQKDKGMTIEEIKAINAAKSSGGDKEPEKDPRKQPLKNPDGNPQNDPTKFRKIKQSDLPHPNPQPEPRLNGMTSKDLKYPDPANPGQYIHQFAARPGHFQTLGEKEKIFLDKLFDEGVFLGHDAAGSFNFTIKDPITGIQGWMKIRPDGKVVDCGANLVHWDRSKYGFLEKPWDTSGESKTGIKLMVGALLASQSPVEAKSLQERAEKKQEEGWPVQKEMAKVMGEMAQIWEDGLPEEAKEKLRQERLEELAKQREVARLVAQKEFDYMQEKVRNARLSKLNPNATIEIQKPTLRIDEVPPKHQKEESSGSGSSSATKSTPLPKMSDSKISEILANNARTSSGSSVGALRLGSFGSRSSGGGLKLGGSQSKFTHKDDDDDDMLWDDDDDEDSHGTCTGLGCL